MTEPEVERERASLLRAITFKQEADAPAASQSLLTKVLGTKVAPNPRVTESLDYEPIQNKIFYQRMKAAKEKRHLATFG